MEALQAIGGNGKYATPLAALATCRLCVAAATAHHKQGIP